MKNLKRNVCAVFVTFIAVVILNPISYAGTITVKRELKISCAQDARTPKIIRIGGKPGVALSVTSKGLLIGEEFYSALSGGGDGSFKIWAKKLYRKVGRDISMAEWTRQVELARTIWSVSAGCTGEDATSLSPVGKTLSCKKEQGLIIVQSSPICDDDVDKKGVVELTITKDVPEAKVAESVSTIIPKKTSIGSHSSIIENTGLQEKASVLIDGFS